MAAAGARPVELGFAESAPAWRLRSEQFPSKVGGRPAWLGAAGLPGPRALACALCSRPLSFLLQVYAPLPGRADAFHRGIFLFCCREPPCCAGLRGEPPDGAETGPCLPRVRVNSGSQEGDGGKHRCRPILELPPPRFPRSTFSRALPGCPHFYYTSF